MTQRKIDDLFSLTTSKSNKRSRTTQVAANDRDELDDLFDTASSTKRRRSNLKPSTDVFDFDTVSKIPKPSSLKKKRSDENQVIDELFNNDTRKKIRRPIKQEEESTDVLDMFKTRTNANIHSAITTTDDFKTPSTSKALTTQKKIKMFFDDTDLISLREQNETKDYAHIKPVLVTSGQWLSKEAETKSTCKPTNSSGENDIPDDQRNLMHIQYASLVLDDDVNSTTKKKSQETKRSTQKLADGKSFQKQLVLSDSTVVRKEHLQSCYNALLEDINKPRLTTASSSSTKLKKLFTPTSALNDHDDDDDDQVAHVDFFDLSTRRKKF
ncbi:unnamed protein product [Adineta ricciae]|uniref:Uncharacterized protein n=1 Tax=Adineta ricciae TaxID=249248 RepID=A0A814KZ42_ADIRI|nr:unnamed protein product [Adineta ricciae]CAF1675314.1 unnamed protein product [Adineta ricciae]